MDFATIFLKEEVASYKIKFFHDIKRVDEIGTITTCLRKMEREIEIQNETEIYAQKLKEKTFVKVKTIDFSPILYESYIDIGQKKIIVIGEYFKNKVELKISSGREHKSLKIDLSDNFYDNASAFYLFRAIALGQLPHNRFYLVNLNAGQKLIVELEKINDEEVRCEMGNFACHAVKMTVPDFSQLPVQKFFYDKNEPHYLIRNIAGPQIIEINKIGGINGSF